MTRPASSLFICAPAQLRNNGIGGQATASPAPVQGRRADRRHAVQLRIRNRARRGRGQCDRAARVHRHAMWRDRPIGHGRGGTAASCGWLAAAALLFPPEQRPMAAAPATASELCGNQEQSDSESASKHGMPPLGPKPAPRVSRVRAVRRDGILPVGSIPRAGVDATREGDFGRQEAASSTACARRVRCARRRGAERSSAPVRVACRRSDRRP
jgi:hypothetical protein